MARPTSRISTKPERTHEGAAAPALTDSQRLRRSVLSCLLFEGTFYEDGEDIAVRILDCASRVPAGEVSALATEARQRHNLRHVPLLLGLALTRRGEMVEATLAGILQRADEPAEFLALLWADGKSPVPHAVRRGIAQALQRFDEYQLAKWGRTGPITIKDILKLCHPEPENDEQSALWARALTGNFVTPDTWEVALSSSADKRETWERLLAEKRLGDLALLRNLRNMAQAGIEKTAIAANMAERQWRKVLPFRFLAAARAVPQWEDIIDAALLSLQPEIRLDGHTIIVVDVSGSMDDPLSAKSDLTRMDAACGIAVMAREMCQSVSIYSFSQEMAQIPPRRGLALRDAIMGSQPHSATYLGAALKAIAPHEPGDSRLIVITDEQAHDEPHYWGRKRYVVNVAPYKTGIGYGGVTHIDGFSERVLDFINEIENPV